jgi:hypothetical protein
MTTPAHGQSAALHCEQNSRPSRERAFRLFVFKEPISPGLVQADKRKRYTSVIATPAYLERVLPYVDGDLKKLTAVARASSLRSKKTAGLSWTETVLEATEQRLKAMHARRAEQEFDLLAREAAENNAQWGG